MLLYPTYINDVETSEEEDSDQSEMVFLCCG